MSVTIRRSIYEASIASLKARYPEPAHAAAAIASFEDGLEVLPDDDPYFQPFGPKPAAQPADDRAKRVTEERQRAARIVEATGIDEAAALSRARRAIAVERGEAFVAGQADLDQMSKAELLAYIADGGELPEDAPSELEDVTDEQMASILAAQADRHAASKVTRERAPFADQRGADLKAFMERGHTTAEAEAKFPWSDYTSAPTRPSASQALQDQMRGLDPSVMGLQPVES